MDWSRRDFFAWMAAGAAAVKSTMSLAAPKIESANPGFSILQGMTDETTAQISIVVPAAQQFSFQAVPVNASVPVPRWTVIERSFAGSPRKVAKLRIEGLRLSEAYLLQVKDATGAVLDEREFKTLGLSQRKVRLGLVSCALDHLHRKNVWRQLEKQRPELLFFLGDNVYCDHKSIGEKIEVPEPALLWERYVATREKVSFYYQKKPGEPLLGQEQEDWVFDTLTPRAALFLNGSVFFGAYGDFESFEGDHRTAFNRFLARLRQSGALAGFVSGDVHYSELMDIEDSVLGYKTFELVSSSIHSYTFPAHHERFENPRRREADSNHNFLIFDAEFADDEIRGHVTCWGSQYDQFDGAVSAIRT